MRMRMLLFIGGVLSACGNGLTPPAEPSSAGPHTTAPPDSNPGQDAPSDSPNKPSTDDSEFEQLIARGAEFDASGAIAKREICEDGVCQVVMPNKEIARALSVHAHYLKLAEDTCIALIWGSCIPVSRRWERVFECELGVLLKACEGGKCTNPVGELGQCVNRIGEENCEGLREHYAQLATCTAPPQN